MIHINLLPVRAARKKEAGKNQLIFFALAVVLGLVGNWQWTHSRAGDLEMRQAKLTKTKKEIEDLKKIIGKVENITAEKKALQDKLAVLDKLKAGKTGPVRMLDELARITPKKLWLTKMDEKGGPIEFDGTAASIDEISEFMGALKKSAFFTDVELKKADLATTDKFKLMNFVVTAKANYTPEASKLAGR